jgi:hypothetical protein
MSTLMTCLLLIAICVSSVTADDDGNEQQQQQQQQQEVSVFSVFVRYIGFRFVVLVF